MISLTVAPGVSFKTAEIGSDWSFFPFYSLFLFLNAASVCLQAVLLTEPAGGFHHQMRRYSHKTLALLRRQSRPSVVWLCSYKLGCFLKSACLMPLYRLKLKT